MVTMTKEKSSLECKPPDGRGPFALGGWRLVTGKCMSCIQPAFFKVEAAGTQGSDVRCPRSHSLRCGKVELEARLSCSREAALLSRRPDGCSAARVFYTCTSCSAGAVSWQLLKGKG